MIDAIIIDDEQLARNVIKKFLEDFSEIQIVAECCNGFEGIKAITEHKPDLIFLDIQMPKLTGFEMLEILEESPVIIFSTAYDQYALKAFDLSAADYLLKPYSKSRFAEAIKKALLKIQNPVDNAKILESIKNETVLTSAIDRIVIRNGAKINIVDLEDIEYLQAQDDYVEIHSLGKKHLKQATMKYYEGKLPDEFVRVHRSFILNINSMDKIEPFSKDSYVAILKNGEKISVSKSGYQLLKDKLNF